jgi:hypothetical protein
MMVCIESGQTRSHVYITSMFYWEVLWFCGQNPAPNALRMHSAELLHYSGLWVPCA